MSQSLVHTRSEITLEDEDTKVGTTVDGEKVRGKGETKVLKNDEHIFKLGSFEGLFKYARTTFGPDFD